MQNARKSTAQPTKSTRITRSISFEIPLHAHVKARAAKERRTFNWIVNEMIRQDTQSN